MPSVILIGGIARVGKTTLVNKLLKKLPYYTLSTDNLKAMGQKFNVMFDNSSSKDWVNPKKWIEQIRSRDYEIWEWSKEYILFSIKENQSIIVEGNLWPDYIYKDIKQFERMGAQVTSLFMIDTSSEKNAAEQLIKLKETDSFNWLNKYDNEKLKQFAKCNNYRSEKLKELAKKHNFMVYDIAEFNSKTEMQDAIKKLILAKI